MTAAASDDVQARNVEFHLNDVRVATDGNHPFELALLAPAPTPERATLRARVAVFAQRDETNRRLYGYVFDLLLPASSNLVAPDIVLRKICAPAFSTAEFPSQQRGGEVNAFAGGDLGNGPALFAATGSFYGHKRAGVFRWSGARWGKSEATSRSETGEWRTCGRWRSSMVAPARRCSWGGDFEQAGGLAATGVARGNGSAWSRLEPGLVSTRVNVSVQHLTEMPGPTRPVLFPGGRFWDALTPNLAGWRRVSPPCP